MQSLSSLCFKILLLFDGGFMTLTQTPLPLLNLVFLGDWPIYDQLRLEEALLRADRGNWCLLNTGSSPAIVMGISGQPEKLLNQWRMATHPLPLIRRFSGGGTVVVDPHTLFVTWIMNSEDLPSVSCYPEPILRWTEQLYAPLFCGLAFQCQGQDYTIQGRKFGGNAQYLCHRRWLHHSSLLWDYEDELMDYLLIPERQPTYRNQRSHGDFLCRLGSFLPTKESLYEGLIQRVKKHFQVLELAADQAKGVMGRPYRWSTCHVQWEL